MSNKKPNILFLVPYPVRRAPSQRFRVELFEPYLQEAGIHYTIAPFMNERTWDVLYKNGSELAKAWGIVKGYLKRLKTVLIDVHQYDYVFVHREAAPMGPPIFEWIVSRLWRKKMLFDFDDAIWIPNTSAENKLASILKAFWKTKYLCKWSYRVIGGNEYLCNYARRFNKEVVLIPTCVDMTRQHNKVKEHSDKQVTIGWTGSHSTIPYLDDIMEVLQYAEEHLNTKFLLIANKKPELPLKNWEFIPWNEKTEVDDLLKIDIGVMPLSADEWSEGKCGFKLIQYLSLGIPAVASPVGVNKVIIEDDVNGFLCASNEEWKNALTKLVNDHTFRKEAGAAGHQKMLQGYSIAANKDKFIYVFS
ncbi:MAG: glycosyltransferase [Chitinophagales bacterium]|nr:glycosyltransferase [Chitinophagaceae bacterium]MCB9065071.1 glycosyltransferase [Chitinophagales bacterium]